MFLKLSPYWQVIGGVNGFRIRDSITDCQVRREFR